MRNSQTYQRSIASFTGLIFLWLFFGVIFLYYTVHLYFTVANSLEDRFSLSDFKIFYSSIHDFYTGGSLYTHTATMPFVRDSAGNGNSPIAQLFLLPFAPLPLPLAGAVWVLLSIGLLYSGLYYLSRIYPFPSQLHWRVALLLFVYISFPVVDTFQLGTWGLIITFLELAAWHYARKGAERRAGILLGLATLIRWPPFALLFYFLVMRRWRVVIFTALTELIGFILALLIFGWNNFSEYLNTLLNSAGGGVENSALAAYDGSLRTFLGRIGAALTSNYTSFVSVIWLGLVVILLGLSAWRCQRLVFDYGYSLSVVLGLLLVPLTWMHYHSVLLLPMVVLVRQQRWPVFYMAILWLSLNPLFQLDFSSNPLLFGSLLSLGLLWLYYALFRSPTSSSVSEEDALSSGSTNAAITIGQEGA